MRVERLEQVSDFEVADRGDRLADLILQQGVHLAAESGVVEKQRAHVDGVAMFDDQKAPRPRRGRGVHHLLQNTDFTFRSMIVHSADPHPRGRPVQALSVRHQRVVPQSHEVSLAPSTRRTR